MKFEQIKLSPKLKDAIQKLGYTDMTMIQEKAIPLVLEGKDVIGESATGSGKTIAFGAGIMDRLENTGLQTLILTPTRELAEQVKDELQKIARPLRIISIYGGVAINPQINAIKRANIVVATPGRLLDHLQRKTINLSSIKFLILDEADRMFEMGFIDDVERIISQCPKKRQTLFFSATITPRVKDLAKRHMNSFEVVAAKRHVDPSKLKQVYYDVKKNIKLSLLVHLLNKSKGLNMVFCNTRRNTDFVVKNLKANQIRAIAIHGGLSQNKRQKTLQMFNDQKVQALVCTDVAARGLHIDNVTHIYNYDLPSDSTDYVHRIGRTARAGESGQVVNLLTDFDHGNFARIMEDYTFNIKKEKAPHVKRVFAKVERKAKRKPIQRHTW